MGPTSEGEAGDAVELLGCLSSKLAEFQKKEGAGALHAKSVSGFVGLRNQGATCYLNSLLQTLYMTPEFRSAIYGFEHDATRHGAPEDCVPLQLRRLFARLQLSERAAVSTTELTRAFGWSAAESFQQHDVQELARVLIDALEQATGDSSIADTFRGQLVDYVQCQRCHHRRMRREAFQDVSLVVEGSGSVEEALRQYIKPERLTGDNAYHCERCDDKVDALKGLGLLRLPEVLVLHLKRFVFDWQTMRRVKLSNRVDIPFALDCAALLGVKNVEGGSAALGCAEAGAPTPVEDSSLSDSLANELAVGFGHRGSAANSSALGESSPHLYELHAVLVHLGTANSGHYYALVRGSRGSRACSGEAPAAAATTGDGDGAASKQPGGDEDAWYEFNDSTVKRLTPRDLTRAFGARTLEAEAQRSQSNDVHLHALTGRSHAFPCEGARAASEGPQPQQREPVKVHAFVRADLTSVRSLASRSQNPTQPRTGVWSALYKRHYTDRGAEADEGGLLANGGAYMVVYRRAAPHAAARPGAAGEPAAAAAAALAHLTPPECDARAIAEDNALVSELRAASEARRDVVTLRRSSCEHSYALITISDSLVRL